MYPILKLIVGFTQFTRKTTISMLHANVLIYDMKSYLHLVLFLSQYVLA